MAKTARTNASPRSQLRNTFVALKGSAKRSVRTSPPPSAQQIADNRRKSVTAFPVPIRCAFRGVVVEPRMIESSEEKDSHRS
jgi:hypothetical protein